VTANWDSARSDSYIADSGATLTKLSDNSIRASGTITDTDYYTVKARTTLTGITGVRLEAIPDSTLPHNGPGRQPLDGNFTLSEFGVGIEQKCPTPSSYPTIDWSSDSPQHQISRDGAQDVSGRTIWTLNISDGARISSTSANVPLDLPAGFVDMTSEPGDCGLFSAQSVGKMLLLAQGYLEAHARLSFWDMSTHNKLGSRL